MRSTTRGVDYDRIAPVYDEPGRDFDPDAYLIQYLSEMLDPLPSFMRILDMGCGTGKQLAADQAILSASQMFGLDLFQGMLRQAQRRSGAVTWVQGDNCNAPFAEASFDYITNQFSYHHVMDKERLLAEAYRILKPGGRVCITDLDPWSMPGWVIYRYFPAAWRRDTADFLTVCHLTSMLKQIGFCNTSSARDKKSSQDTLGGFLAYATRRDRTSQLIAISDRDYERGIAGLRGLMKRYGSQAIVPSEICVARVIGDKPE